MNIKPPQDLEMLDYPSADISFLKHSEEHLQVIVTMHFSRVVDGLEKDLELRFESPLALQWEEESYGLIEAPENLSKCSAKGFEAWIRPFNIINPSKWADTYAANIYSDEEFANHDLKHFMLISMNDLLHVLSNEQPVARFLD